MLALVTILLIVSVSADPDTDKLRRSCVTSDECLAANSNTECDPVLKICFCQPGYGIDYELDAKSCQKYPFEKVHFRKFEDDIDLNCKIFTSNFTDINWYRDGVLCTHGSSCSQDENIFTFSNKTEHYFKRSLWVKYVIGNHTYTCQSIDKQGKPYTVIEKKVIAGMQSQNTIYSVPGINRTIVCPVRSSNLEPRLVRDDKDFCTPETTWCKITMSRNTSRLFDIQNVRENRTFTCEAYKGEEKIGTISLLRVVIGEKPKIVEITTSPPNSSIPRGTEVFATARIYSPNGVPNRQWNLTYYGNEVKYLKDNLTVLSGNEYNSTVSLGQIQPHNMISFTTSNIYGKDSKNIRIWVDNN